MRKIIYLLFCVCVSAVISYATANKIYPPVSPVSYSDQIISSKIYEGEISTASFSYLDGNLVVLMRNLRMVEETIVAPTPSIDGTALDFNMMIDRPLHSTSNEKEGLTIKFSFPIEPGNYSVTFGDALYREMMKTKPGGVDQNFVETPFQLTIEEGMDVTVNVEYPVTETMFAEDVEWYYTVDTNEYDPSTFLCRFIGAETIDDKTYHPYYYCQGDEWVEENKQLMAYMRNEGSNVYTLPADVTLPSYLWLKDTDYDIYPKDLIDGEVLVYSFVPPMAPEKIMVPNLINNTFEAIEALTYDWRHDGSIIFNDEIVWSPYRGSTGRGCNLLPYPVYNYLNSDSSKVYPVRCSRIRKINNGQGAVGAISDSLQEGEVRYYDLQGLPVSNPSPGQLIIEQTPSGTRKLIH